MMYEEFTARAKRPITLKQYTEEIEPVYTYHPAIEDKDECAALYDLLGIAVFRDMRPTADRAKEIDDELYTIRQRQSELVKELRHLKGEP